MCAARTQNKRHRSDGDVPEASKANLLGRNACQTRPTHRVHRYHFNTQKRTAYPPTGSGGSLATHACPDMSPRKAKNTFTYDMK